MKERNTSSRKEMQPLLSDSPIIAITCKAGNKICRSLKLSSLPNGEANNYKRVGLDRVGGVGIPSFPIRDPLPSAPGPKLTLNRRAMIFMLRPRETHP
ncbi:hypothetical protein H5410_031129 [Solanum commersonii]|uniref:Uncharacterized protein n=1 Tax=Solanum commersonii TaxID=4109 RepID=A0A9J5YJ07_SOLCO|nr:hypothetical protein H5410_031129 [Solanum commersonii]